MAVSPQLVSGILEGAGRTGQGITDVAVAYSDQRGVRANRAQLEELERRAAMGMLGLDSDQLELARQRTQGAAQAAMRQAEAQGARQAAAQRSGDVRSIAERQAALQALGAIQARTGTALTQADLAQRQAQLQEIEARRAADAQVRARRAQAVGRLLTGGVLGGAQSVMAGGRAGGDFYGGAQESQLPATPEELEFRRLTEDDMRNMIDY